MSSRTLLSKLMGSAEPIEPYADEAPVPFRSKTMLCWHQEKPFSQKFCQNPRLRKIMHALI